MKFRDTFIIILILGLVLGLDFLKNLVWVWVNVRQSNLSLI